MEKLNPLTQEQIDQLIKLENLRLDFEHVQEAVIALEDCFAIGLRSKTGRCFSLPGETGVGKSSIVHKFIRNMEKKYGGSPILYVEVPEDSSVKYLAASILSALGDPLAHRGTRGQMEGRITKLVQHMGIKMIVLDEFQHLMCSENRKVLNFTANWLKSLVNVLGIPFVFVGMPEQDNIFAINRQLKRRTKYRFQIRPFSWDSEEACQEVMMIMAVLDRALPFKKRSALTRKGVDRFIIQASGGSIGYIMRLIVRATEIALKAGAETLEKHHIHSAFEELELNT